MSLTVLSPKAGFRAIVSETDNGASAVFEQSIDDAWKQIAATAIPYPFHTSLDIAGHIVDNLEACGRIVDSLYIDQSIKNHQTTD